MFLKFKSEFISYKFGMQLNLAKFANKKIDTKLRKQVNKSMARLARIFGKLYSMCIR